MTVAAKVGSMQCDVQRVSATHTPTDRADAIRFHIFLALEKRDRGLKIALGAIRSHPSHQLMGHIRILRDLASIQIDGQDDIALVGKFR